jgi:hypothetical protein
MPGLWNVPDGYGRRPPQNMGVSPLEASTLEVLKNHYKYINGQ